MSEAGCIFIFISGSSVRVIIIPISRYFPFFSFSGTADHRILILKLWFQCILCAQRLAHHSNAPSKSLTARELFSWNEVGIRLVLSVYYPKPKARSGCSVTCCEANGWRVVFSVLLNDVLFELNFIHVLTFFLACFSRFFICPFVLSVLLFENITPKNRPIN